MPDPVITCLEQVTPEWLTEVLTRNGALAQGAVAAFDVDTGGGNWSTNASLRVRYVEGAQGARPHRLFLKLVNADLGDGESFDDSEVNYYTRDYAGVAGAPLVRCYAAAFSGALKRYHLLLDDLSETHVEAAAKAPTLEYGLALAEGLAVMHAHWWGAARLAQAGAAWHSAQHIQRFVEIAEPGAGHILQHVSDRLEPHWPETIRTLYARHPAALVARARDAGGSALFTATLALQTSWSPALGTGRFT